MHLLTASQISALQSRTPPPAHRRLRTDSTLISTESSRTASLSSSSGKRSTSPPPNTASARRSRATPPPASCTPRRRPCPRCVPPQYPHSTTTLQPRRSPHHTRRPHHAQGTPTAVLPVCGDNDVAAIAGRHARDDDDHVPRNHEEPRAHGPRADPRCSRSVAGW